jgi:hypothetical protein
MCKDCEVDPEKEQIKHERYDNETNDSGQEVFRKALLHWLINI